MHGGKEAGTEGEEGLCLGGLGDAVPGRLKSWGAAAMAVEEMTAGAAYG